MTDGPCGPHCGPDSTGKYMIHCFCSQCHEIPQEEKKKK